MAKTEELYANALTLSRAFNDNFVDLASTLRELQDNDPERFRDFVQASSMGLRKAYYLVSVDKTFKPLKVPKKKLIEIGWTKLMLIQPHVTKQNVLEMIDYAKSHTAAELKSYLKGTPIDDNSHAVTMYFNPEDYGKLMAALVQNGASKSGRGLVDKEKAIMHLVESITKKD